MFIAPVVFILIACYLSLKCLCVCVVTVLSTIPTALSAEYPACDPSYWAFQLLARSISAKGEQLNSVCSYIMCVLFVNLMVKNVKMFVSCILKVT